MEQSDAPFYHVYGGTQDNNTLGGPARTMSVHGITNADWFVIVGGDGFHCQVDPKDPNMVYAESQYGGLVRFDRRTGERVRHPAEAGRRRAAAAVELGLAPAGQPAHAARGSTSPPTSSSAATIAATRGRRSAATCRGSSTATSCR